MYLLHDVRQETGNPIADGVGRQITGPLCRPCNVRVRATGERIRALTLGLDANQYTNVNA